MKKIIIAVLLLLFGCRSFDFEKVDIALQADRLKLSEAIITDADLMEDLCDRPELVSQNYMKYVCDKEDYLDGLEDYLEDNEFEERYRIIENNIQSGYDTHYGKNYTMHVVSAKNDSNLKFTIIYMKYQDSAWSLEYIKKN
jgi:hypothetical protein